MNNNENIVIFKVTSEFFEENGYIVHLEGKSKAIIFDPGSDVDQFLEYLSGKNLKLEAICLTHAHPDHIAGVSGIKVAFPDAKIAIGLNEAAACSRSEDWEVAPTGAMVFYPLRFKVPISDMKVALC